MKKLKDLVLRYGVLLRKRFSEKDKLKFLQMSQMEFESMGYQVDVTQTKIRAGKLGSKSYYNLYAGDYKNADLVISTYYDTPVKSFNIYKQEAFNSEKPKSYYIINFIIQLLIIGSFSALFIFALMPRLMDQSILSFWGVLSFLILGLGLYLIKNTRLGIANKNNMIRNNSSVIAMFGLAEKNKGKNIAFSFIDDGTNDSYVGVKLLDDYLPSKRIKKIYLDSIGNSGDIIVFTNDKFEGKLPKSSIKTDLNKRFDYLITSGTIENESVIIDKANTGKDKDLDLSDLELKINKLNKVINKIK